MSQDLTIWTIYANPSDFPGLYVLRAHDCQAGKSTPRPVAHTRDTLEAIRELLPPGLTRLPRDPADDPVIVECWI